MPATTVATKICPQCHIEKPADLVHWMPVRKDDPTKLRSNCRECEDADRARRREAGYFRGRSRKSKAAATPAPTITPYWETKIPRRRNGEVNRDKVKKVMLATPGAHCYLCGGDFSGRDDRRYEGQIALDHIIPVNVCRERGIDPDQWHNYAPTHQPCNDIKNGKPAYLAACRIMSARCEATDDVAPAPDAPVKRGWLARIFGK